MCTATFPWRATRGAVTLLVLALFTVAACSSPTAPSSGGTATPAVAPFSLSRGDLFRIEFRVNPAAWAGGAAPDAIFLRPGGGQADGAGDGCLHLEVFDGNRRIGNNPEAICGPVILLAGAGTANPGQTPVDFTSILAGTIQGRIDLRLRATRMTSDALYDMSFAKADPARGPGYFTGIAGGINILSQSIIR